MNKMKKFLAAFIAIGTLLTMAGCGADETSDSTISTSKSESVTDKETAEQTELVVEEKTEVTAGGASPPPRRYELLKVATDVIRRKWCL